jgi:hypothetical protein
MQPITAPRKNWTRSSDLMLPQVEFESTYSDNRNHDGESTTNHHPDTKPSGFGAKQPAIPTEAEVTEN